MIPNLLLGIWSLLLAGTSPSNSQQLITEMHTRYHGKFNKNITFILFVCNS